MEKLVGDKIAHLLLHLVDGGFRHVVKRGIGMLQRSIRRHR